MPIQIKIKVDAKQLSKGLEAMVKKQIPYAASQAINAISKRVKLLEQKNIRENFPTAKPFTVSGVSLSLARKNNPTAIIDLKPITAKYLQPFEMGGPHFVANGRLMLDPVRQQVDNYGNVPKGTFAKLKSRPDVFQGVPKGGINKPYGLWQRPFLRERDKAKNVPIWVRKKLRGKSKVPRGSNTTGRLKLLILMAGPLTVTPQLKWHALAEGCVRARWQREFSKAMKLALGTAK